MKSSSSGSSSVAHIQRKQACDAPEVARLVAALGSFKNYGSTKAQDYASATADAHTLRTIICTARRNRLAASQLGAGAVVVALCEKELSVLEANGCAVAAPETAAGPPAPKNNMFIFLVPLSYTNLHY